MVHPVQLHVLCQHGEGAGEGGRAGGSTESSLGVLCSYAEATVTTPSQMELTLAFPQLIPLWR